MRPAIEKPTPAEKDHVPLAEPELPEDAPGPPRPATRPIDAQDALDTQEKPD